jgi:carbonic anhydrase
VTGTLNNWGFGPAFTIDHDPASTDFSTLPALTFDNTTVHLSGWHVHFPSEHLVDGVKARAEMHMVCVTATGEPAAVVGVRIEPNLMSESAFFKQVPTPLVGLPGKEGDAAAAAATEVKGVVMDPMLAIAEVGGGHEYWTYGGSLTTPPCSEGLRWFVMARPLMVSQAQLVAMLEVGKFSSRREQSVFLQMVNQ